MYWPTPASGHPQVGFLQDLVAVDIPSAEETEPDGSRVPEMTVIGHIKHRLVVAPDWTKLFGSEMPSSSDDEDDDTNSW